jgi:hypothetical protein
VECREGDKGKKWKTKGKGMGEKSILTWREKNCGQERIFDEKRREVIMEKEMKI